MRLTMQILTIKYAEERQWRAEEVLPAIQNMTLANLAQPHQPRFEK